MIFPNGMGISRCSSSSIFPHIKCNHSWDGIHLQFHCSQECLYEPIQQHGEIFNVFISSLHVFKMGATLYDDSVDMVMEISNLPSVASHCVVLTIDIYFAFSSSDANSQLSNSRWSLLSIGLDCFLSVSPGNIFSWVLN